MFQRSMLPMTVFLIAACADQLPMQPDTQPAFDIADAAHGFQSGFYWLPPMVQQQPAYNGQFDAHAAPVVEICRMNGDVCAETITSLSEAASTLEKRVSLEGDGKYLGSWNTSGLSVNPDQRYRVSVFAGNHVLMGYADIQPVSNSGFTNVDTNEFIKLKEDGILPIIFRIETGIVGSIEVQPSDATANPGGTQQFVAVVRDLHGNLLSNAGLQWSTSNEAIAIVNAHGLATAIADGEASITATSHGISGSASFRVAGSTVTNPVTLTAGLVHACALNAEGRAFCWGRNHEAQLGDGTLIDRPGPSQVAGDLRFMAISAGDWNTCALTAAGHAYCWGLNQHGEVGDGTRSQRTSPTPVQGGLQFVSISVGSHNACALTAAGQAYCWGQAGFGAIGNGSIADYALTPTLVAGGHQFAIVDVGSQFVCGVTTANAAYCWGEGSFARLGNGSTTNLLAPFPVSGGHAFGTITTGVRHACAIDAEHRAYCWGAGSLGRLGDGSGQSALTPVPMPVVGNVSFAQISAGGVHTCGVSTTGEGYCWGGLFSLNLGTNVFPHNLQPTPVVGGHTWTHIIASGIFGQVNESGDAFSCGVTVQSQTYCWGTDLFGQLGNGSPVGNMNGIPQPVSLP